MKHFTALIILAYLALCGLASAQSGTALLRKTLSTNAITEGFTLPSGQTLIIASGGTLQINGTTTLADDIKITFNPGTTTAGLNVGSLAGDPSSLANGDLWYDSTANELSARINGATVALGAGGGGMTIGGAITGGTTTRLLFNLGGNLADDADLTFATDTLTATKLVIGGGSAITSSGAGGALGTAAFTAATAYQAADADLTTYAGITPSANVQSILGAANYAAINSLLGIGGTLSGLTATRVPFAASASTLTDDANLTFDSTFDVLYVGSVAGSRVQIESGATPTVYVGNNSFLKANLLRVYDESVDDFTIDVSADPGTVGILWANTTTGASTRILFADAAAAGRILTAPNVTGTIISTGNLTDITGLTDSQISNTLTASIFVGSGSTTNAVDLATAEVAGTLAVANLAGWTKTELDTLISNDNAAYVGTANTFTAVNTFAAGSVSAPSITATGMTADTGIYSTGVADEFAIATAGLRRFYISAAGLFTLQNADGSGTVGTFTSNYGSCTVSIGGAGLRLSTLSSTGYGSFQIDSGGGNINYIDAKAAGVLGIGNTSSVGGTLRFIPTTPAQITANQDNYNPGGVSYYQRWSTDASRNVTGLTFTATKQDGQTHVIVNVGSFDIVLKHETTSTAANRFQCTTGADITLTPNQEANCWYDATTQRWRVSKRN